ncbi:acyl-CoA synthetase [Microbacterium thalassium]|uniref:Acyl-CoA synthetase (AMP-forming)/AMP-acid ligase II n=1 Tax=Microbacterium thalassium TaxID=362649 RepID=A0A7X0FU54_9MICO|nr:long-chain fatty acid--CoA ligase [Microbacterium thalassium]MBB6393041.1 acyl-CoA synthetase (AMP-forming)/AMP-acid ligase II [Microbacterium thalassium]GLK22728.1 acyl-CoA synthetase [Microbacterium thalassium]
MSTSTGAFGAPHSQIPPTNYGLGTWAERRVLLAPDLPAWTFEGESTSYAEVDRRVRKLAGALADLGVRHGDRVAYMGFNHPALLETLFALGRIGAIAVLVNARLSHGEVGYILNDSGARMLLFGAEQRAIARMLEQEAFGVQMVSVDYDAGDDETWAREYEALLAAGSEESTPAAVGLDDPCLIMYTSGTTGRPKGAVLSHANMTYSGLNMLISTDLRTGDVSLAVAPLFHIAGLNALVLPMFLKGGHILIQRHFDPVAVVGTLRELHVNSMFAVPAMLDAMAGVDGFEVMAFPDLRTLIVGGAPVPSRVLRQWNSKGVELQQGYGFTEAAPAVTLLSPAEAIRKEGSAGKQHFFTDVRVVAADGHDAAVGESGEIYVRGLNIMLGYWDNPRATAESFDGEWYKSGDVAEKDEHGFHFLKDRSKDMFISGGENVYPSEVESALLDVPGVVEAAVIGVPDERWGEVGKALIVLEAGAALDADGMRAALADGLARYKIPKLFEFVAELPRTATGKVQKHLLRDAHAVGALS